MNQEECVISAAGIADNVHAIETCRPRPDTPATRQSEHDADTLKPKKRTGRSRRNPNIFKRAGKNSVAAFNAASQMPPLKWQDAMVWLGMQHDIRQMIFTTATAAGVIVFDQDAGRWRGCGVSPDTNTIKTKEAQCMCQ